MIGIYGIKNKITNKIVYIGQSVNIRQRWLSHLSTARTYPNKDSHKPLYRSMRKNGLENFENIVIEECSEELLDEKEKYYIESYDTFYNGYNLTLGGKNCNTGIKNKARAKLSKDDVIQIRTAYKNHKLMINEYEKYSDRIGLSGFKKIWNGYTWKEIMPEIYTPENIAINKHNSLSHNQSLIHKKGIECYITYKGVKLNNIIYPSVRDAALFLSKEYNCSLDILTHTYEYSDYKILKLSNQSCYQNATKIRLFYQEQLYTIEELAAMFNYSVASIKEIISYKTY